jgi:hypothetical protein
MVSLRRASVATCPDTSGAGTGTPTFEVSDFAGVECHRASPKSFLQSESASLRDHKHPAMRDRTSLSRLRRNPCK